MMYYHDLSAALCVVCRVVGLCDEYMFVRISNTYYLVTRHSYPISHANAYRNVANISIRLRLRAMSYTAVTVEPSI